LMSRSIWSTRNECMFNGTHPWVQEDRNRRFKAEFPLTLLRALDQTFSPDDGY
jgi:hypothetical protein